MKILFWKKKTNQNKQRVFRLLFRRKKINGARKEIFLNEKKNSFAWCWIINLLQNKHTKWWYIYTPSIFTTTKNQTISRNFWRRYIFVFLSLLLLLLIIINFLFSFFNYFFSSLFCPCHLITKVCESLLRYTCMNVVCKIEHIKKTMVPPSKEKKSPKIPPSIFFSCWPPRRNLIAYFSEMDLTNFLG